MLDRLKEGGVLSEEKDCVLFDDEEEVEPVLRCTDDDLCGRRSE